MTEPPENDPPESGATAASEPSRCRQCEREVESGREFCENCGTRIVSMPGTEAPPQSNDPFLGMTLKKRYRVQRRLGSGSMGTVYEALHLALQKIVAVKILHPSLQLSEDAVRRFQQEGVIAGRFHHPGAIEVFDFDRDECGAVYLAMERIEGKTLRQVLEEHGTYAPRAAVELLIHILEVLAAAHEEGIIHRDLKPDNVMLVEAPTPEASVKVLDFGVSKILDFHNENTMLTRTGQILGTPLYMSPEQCAGDDVDVRSDVYAAGLLLFELMVGHPPFSGRNLTELLIKHATGRIPSLADACPGQEIPQDLERIVARTLQKDPDRRFATAEDLLKALRAIRYERVMSQSALGRFGRQVGRGLSRHPGRVAAAVFLVMLVGTAVWVILRPPGDNGNGAIASGDPMTESERAYQRNLGLAQDAVLKRDAREALDAMATALQEREFPDAEGYLTRGRAYELNGDIDGARADFQGALDLRPEWAEPLCAMGWLEHGLGDFVDAGERFEEARKLDDGSAEAYAGLAALALDAEEWPEAERLLTQAQERNAEYWRVHLLWGRWHLSQDDEGAALAALVEARRLQARDPEVWVALSRVHERKGDPEQAEGMAEEAVRLNPEHRDASRRRAYVALQRGRFEDASLFLGDWLRRHPEDAEMQLLLAVAECEQGNEGEALDLVRKSLRKEPRRQVEAWVLRGTLEHGLGMLAEAVESYESALIMDATHAGAHRSLGMLHMQRQEFTLAAEHLEQAARTEADTELLHALGVLYWEYLGDRRVGRVYFQQYRDSGGLDPRALSIAGTG